MLPSSCHCGIVVFSNGLLTSVALRGICHYSLTRFCWCVAASQLQVLALTGQKGRCYFQKYIISHPQHNHWRLYQQLWWANTDNFCYRLWKSQLPQNNYLSFSLVHTLWETVNIFHFLLSFRWKEVVHMVNNHLVIIIDSIPVCYEGRLHNAVRSDAEITKKNKFWFSEKKKTCLICYSYVFTCLKFHILFLFYHLQDFEILIITWYLTKFTCRLQSQHP